MKKTSPLLLIIFCSTILSAGNAAKTGDLQYIQNNGQWQNQIAFSADIYGGRLFLEKNCFTWAFTNESELSDFKHKGNADELNNFIIKRHAFKTNFMNSNPDVKLSGEHAFDNYYNYFLGNDQTEWHSKVPAFNQVRYENLYDGIDMVIYSQDNSMKYDLIVAPHTSPRTIRINYEGLDKISLNDGNLELTTSLNKIIEYKPYAYQIINGIKIEVPCKFQLWENEVSFIFPEGHNSNYELIIDPATLIFASYSGSTTDNWGFSATYDAAGNLYGAGVAFAIGYPVTLGAYQESWAGGTGIYVADIAISKFSPDGTSLIYSTYLGGTGEELPFSMTVNNLNELIVYGVTGSSDFPVTDGIIDDSFNGGAAITLDYVLNFTDGSDGLISIFNEAGTDLIASTFIGGSGNDALNAGITEYNYADYSRSSVIHDEEGNIYLASTTASTDLPVSLSAFQTSAGGGFDGFVAKVNSSLTEIKWLSYLGGSTDDAAYSIHISNENLITVGGGTNSIDFPATSGALNESYSGGIDGFVAIINSDASNLLHATYIGTIVYDQVYLLDRDTENSIYITGQTNGDYPVIGSVYSIPGSSQFITRLDSTLSEIEISTVFGNGAAEVNLAPTAFFIDSLNQIYYAGWGGNVNYVFNPNIGDIIGLPVTADAFKLTTDGSDFYFMLLGSNADSLLYASFFGGELSNEHVDGGTSNFDKNGILYEAVCAGCAGNDDFPVTDDVVGPENLSANCNLGVLKFDMGAEIIDTTITSVIDFPLNSFEIFPNPVYSDELNISLNSQENISVSIEITNANGELVFLKNKQHLNTGGQIINLKLPELSAGLYYLTVRMKENAFSKSFSIIN